MNTRARHLALETADDGPADPAAGPPAAAATTPLPPPAPLPPGSESVSLRDALGLVPDNQLVAAELHPFPRDGEQRFECGGCGSAWVGRGIRPSSAAAFCPTCDYPLFFARKPKPAVRPDTTAARRRLPGVEGRDGLGRIVCRFCGEPNNPDPDALCVRCAEPLSPRPAHVVEVEVVKEVPVEVVKLDRSWAWVSAALGFLLAISFAVNVVLANGH